MVCCILGTAWFTAFWVTACVVMYLLSHISLVSVMISNAAQEPKLYGKSWHQVGFEPEPSDTANEYRYLMCNKPFAKFPEFGIGTAKDRAARTGNVLPDIQGNFCNRLDLNPQSFGMASECRYVMRNDVCVLFHRFGVGTAKHRGAISR